MSAVSERTISLEELEARIGCRLPHETAAGEARLHALLADTREGRKPTSLVAYQSAGSVAIVGDEARGREVAARLAAPLECTLVVPTGGEPRAARADDAQPDEPSQAKLRTIRADVAGVHGYLGHFGIKGRVNGEQVDVAPSLITANRYFDIVVDLCAPAWIASEVPPPGYFAAADEAGLERALAEAPGLVGEFEKPRFFGYDPDICAHGASGIEGCRRCIDACPTDAIASIGERVEVNPYLCQGGGSCVAACPTGAMTYAYPTVKDLLASLRRILAAYREAGGERPVVLLHDGEAGREWLARHAARLPEHVIPCELEETASLGMDAWLGLIAYGAAGVALLCMPGMPPAARRELEAQHGFAIAILAGLGLDAALLRLLEGGDDAATLAALAAPLPDTGLAPATFQALDEKRTTIRLAVEHLYAQRDGVPPTAPLPAGAPFGELLIDRGACTLCMACVSVCPAGALRDGGEEPKLHFIEWNCVQCGLCETACPEDAITRQARFVYDPALRRESRVLNEDAPFHCVGCGKPFATTRVIERMRSKLAGHWMFQKPEAVRRLEMCEDCRVRDMFKDGGGLMDVHDDG